jgi:hypothetical protein
VVCQTCVCLSVCMSEASLKFSFLDDMAHVSDTVIGLQRQLNVLHEFCGKYGMNVNLDKTRSWCLGEEVW